MMILKTILLHLVDDRKRNHYLADSYVKKNHQAFILSFLYELYC